MTDGIRVAGGASASWTLLLLRADDQAAGVAELAATLETILRRGRDRAGVVRHDGVAYAAALLAVARENIAPVLVRLEAELTGADRSPAYAVVAVTADRRAEFSLTAADLVFAPLRLPLPVRGGKADPVVDASR